MAYMEDANRREPPTNSLLDVAWNTLYYLEETIGDPHSLTGTWLTPLLVSWGRSETSDGCGPIAFSRL